MTTKHIVTIIALIATLSAAKFAPFKTPRARKLSVKLSAPKFPRKLDATSQKITLDGSNVCANAKHFNAFAPAWESTCQTMNDIFAHAFSDIFARTNLSLRPSQWSDINCDVTKATEWTDPSGMTFAMMVEALGAACCSGQPSRGCSAAADMCHKAGDFKPEMVYDIKENEDGSTTEVNCLSVSMWAKTQFPYWFPGGGVKQWSDLTCNAVEISTYDVFGATVKQQLATFSKCCGTAGNARGCGERCDHMYCEKFCSQWAYCADEAWADYKCKDAPPMCVERCSGCSPPVTDEDDDPCSPICESEKCFSAADVRTRPLECAKCFKCYTGECYGVCHDVQRDIICVDDADELRPECQPCLKCWDQKKKDEEKEDEEKDEEKEDEEKDEEKGGKEYDNDGSDQDGMYPVARSSQLCENKETGEWTEKKTLQIADMHDMTSMMAAMQEALLRGEKVCFCLGGDKGVKPTPPPKPDIVSFLGVLSSQYKGTQNYRVIHTFEEVGNQWFECAPLDSQACSEAQSCEWNKDEDACDISDNFLDRKLAPLNSHEEQVLFTLNFHGGPCARLESSGKCEMMKGCAATHVSFPSLDSSIYPKCLLSPTFVDQALLHPMYCERSYCSHDCRATPPPSDCARRCHDCEAETPSFK